MKNRTRKNVKTNKTGGNAVGKISNTKGENKDNKLYEDFKKNYDIFCNDIASKRCNKIVEDVYKTLKRKKKITKKLSLDCLKQQREFKKFKRKVLKDSKRLRCTMKKMQKKAPVIIRQNQSNRMSYARATRRKLSKAYDAKLKKIILQKPNKNKSN